MYKKEIALLVFSAIIIATLFIRGFYNNKVKYKEEFAGILLVKNLGSRGSYNLEIYDMQQKRTIKKNYTALSIYKKLSIGDSISKNRDSYFLKIYYKDATNFIFMGSFEFGHW